MAQSVVSRMQVHHGQKKSDPNSSKYFPIPAWHLVRIRRLQMETTPRNLQTLRSNPHLATCRPSKRVFRLCREVSLCKSPNRVGFKHTERWRVQDKNDSLREGKQIFRASPWKSDSKHRLCNRRIIQIPQSPKRARSENFGITDAAQRTYFNQLSKPRLHKRRNNRRRAAGHCRVSNAKLNIPAFISYITE